MEGLVGSSEADANRVSIELPEIAENGNTVPFSVAVESPMTDEDHVKAVHVFATGNPRPDIGSFMFTPANGVADASSRMRLGRTQDIVAVAEMSNGQVFMATQTVKVTIGGCGG
jgi:sulfur-oxidizing protein SoxY